MTAPQAAREAFSFAVQAPPARHADAWTDLAREAEQLGYRALLVPDHQGDGGPIAGMAVAGAATRSLRVGSLMLAAELRNPVLLAEELITLDALLGGRVEAGLGAGWMSRDFERSGVERRATSVRIDRLREAVEILRGMSDGRSLEHRGAHFRVRDAVAGAAQGGRRMTVVLGGGGRRMLHLAAELADIVNLSATMASGDRGAPLGETASEGAFARRVAWVEEEARQHDRAPVLQCLAFATALTGDALAYASRELVTSFGLRADEVLRSPLALVGTVEELCWRLETHRQRLGISYWVVKAPVMRDFSAVVTRLAGR